MLYQICNTPLCLPPRRHRQGHKGTYGTVLGISGSRGMAGAVALAGRAALLSGAGLVRLAIPDPILETVAGYSPEPTTIPCSADEYGRFALDALEPLLTHAERCTALFLGPGLGRSDVLDQLVPLLLQKNTKPVVVDADALNALAVHMKRFENIPFASHKDTKAQNKITHHSDPLCAFVPPCGTKKDKFCLKNDGDHFPHRYPIILTPHAGEFARLRNEPTPSEEYGETRKAAALEFARKFGILLVLKGHETIITDGERLALNSTGNPGMATGGSGDVLTGIIAGLIAQNFSPIFETVRLAVHLHGLAGDIAAEQLGEESVTATAILDAIPGAFAQSRQSAMQG